MKKLSYLTFLLSIFMGFGVRAGDPAPLPATLEGASVDEDQVIESAGANLRAHGFTPKPIQDFKTFDRYTFLEKIEKATEEQARMQKKVLDAVKKAPAVGKAPKITTGNIIAVDNSTVGRPYVTADMTLSGSNGEYTMKNVYGLGEDVEITMTIDEQTGTVTVKPQQLTTHSTYGRVYFASFNPSDFSYNTRTAVTGTIDEDGVITLGPWCVVVPTGEYKGRLFNAFYSSYWAPQNATVSTNSLQSGNDKNEFKPESHPAYVRQINQNEAAIYNLGGIEDAYIIILTPQKTWKISPQYAFRDINYGEFDCFAADWDGQKIYNDRVICANQLPNGHMFIDGWAISCKSSPTLLYRAFKDTDIELSKNLDYPADLGSTFDGNGTEASPYKLSVPEDFVKLSRCVEAGNNYAGKVFALANNIDMSGLNLMLEPIGSVSAPFSGIIKGNNFSIDNLYISSLGLPYGGLVGYLGKGGRINNITFNNPRVQGNGNFIGIVCGMAEGSLSGIVINNGIVAGHGYLTGGIAGAAFGGIDDSYANVTVEGTGNCGGIAGWAASDVTACHAEGSINIKGYNSLYHSTGGVAGTFSVESSSSKFTMKECSFNGQITDEVGGASIGGLLGTAYFNVIEQCFAVASISAHNAFTDPDKDTYTGGLIGYISHSELYDSYAAGNLIKPEKSVCTGGLVGNVSVSYTISTGKPTVINNVSKIERCYSSVQMSTESTNDYKGLYGYCGAMYGFDPVSMTFKDVYFDQQVNDFRNERWGRATSFFADGTLPEGFSPEVWSAVKGTYPVLKKIPNTQAVQLSSAVVSIKPGEWAGKVKSPVTLQSSDNISWFFFNGETMTKETENAVITGNTVTFKENYASEMIVAIIGEQKNSTMKFVLINIVPKWFEGEGTESSPYLIKNASDFEKLDRAVGVYKQSHRDDFFKVANDIDFTGSTFQGVGAKRGSTSIFNGVFDGAGHSIHNLALKAGNLNQDKVLDEEISWPYAGLFAQIGPFGTLKNLTVAEDCSFNVALSSGIFAYMNSGRIENCVNNAPLEAIRGVAAGIVAVNSAGAVVTDCYNGGSVKVGESYGAGIVAQNSGSVLYCQNDGDISALKLSENYKKTDYNTVGGAVAYNFADITGCLNQGTISAVSKVGGIVAENSNAHSTTPTVKGCLSTGLLNVGDAGTTSRGAIAAVGGSKIILSDNIYDCSVIRDGGLQRALPTGIVQKYTSELISGSPVNGLDKEKFAFVKDSYPVLKNFASLPKAKALSNIYLFFGKGENIGDVKKDTPLSSAEGIKWTLETDGTASIFGVNGSTLTVGKHEGENLSKAVLKGLGDNKYQKTFSLRSVPVIFEGEGTQQSPYLIRTTDDMTHLAEFMETNSMDYDGYYFRLENDLDYTGKTFTPVARKTVSFQADFNGNGKTIKGYDVDLSGSSKNGEGAQMGLWGTIGNMGSVHDLKLDGKFYGFTYCGGLVGNLYGKVYNCEMRGEVYSKSDHIGGFAYRLYEGASIKVCKNYARVACLSRYGTGGIAAYTEEGSVIEGCVNYGVLSAYEYYAGGIAYRVYGTIRNCVNEGKFVGPTEDSHGNFYAGIAVTLSGNASLINCENRSDISINASLKTSQTQLGGIYCNQSRGSANSWSNITLENCINYGNLTLNMPVKSSGTSLNPTGVAGIGLSLADNATVKGCINYGKITATGKGYVAGGFASLAYSYPDAEFPRLITITDTHNYGDVSSEDVNCAGLLADTGVDNIYVDCSNHGNVTSTGEGICVGGFSSDGYGSCTRCYNTGNVKSAAGATGGFIGLISQGTYTDCFNTGDVETTAFNKNGTCGGFTGDIRSDAIIRDCFTMGKVTAPGWVAGFIGKAPSDLPKIENCYSASKVTCTGYDTDGNGTPEYIGGSFLLCNNPSDKDFKNIKNVYYDTDLLPEKTSFDIEGSGKTTRQLLEMDLGENWTNLVAFYPMPTASLNIYGKHSAANILMADNDNASSISAAVTLASDKDLAWTGSEHFNISEGKAYPVALGKGWLKVEAMEGKLSKTFELTVAALSSISDIDADGKEIASRIFFDLSGRQVSSPVPGTVYLQRTLFSDGTQSVEKVVFMK